MSGLTDEQAALRQRGVGGSDVAAILGISPWKSAYHLYLEKTGELPRDTSDNPAQRWGRKLEALILEEWQAQTGLTIYHEGLLTHRDHDWAMANVDGLAHDLDDRTLPGRVSGVPWGCLGVVEAKSATQWKAGEWAGDSVPPPYLAQIQWYLEVTDLPLGWIAVLIGGNDFRIYDVVRDRDIGAMLLERCGEFWDRVQRRDPPEPDGAQSTTDVLNRLYASVGEDDVTYVDSEAVDLVRDYWWAHADEKAAKARKDEAANRLRARLGGHQLAVCDGQTVATWKPQSRVALDQKRLQEEQPDVWEKYQTETTYRVLRPSQTLKGDT